MFTSWLSLAASQDRLDLTCVNKFPASTLCKFVDELPIPGVIDTSDGKLVDIGSYKIKQVCFSDAVYLRGLAQVQVYTVNRRCCCTVLSTSVSTSVSTSAYHPG